MFTNLCPAFRQEKEELRVLTVKRTFMRRISPAFLAPELVQDGNLSMASDLDN